MLIIIHINILNYLLNKLKFKIIENKNKPITC